MFSTWPSIGNLGWGSRGGGTIHWILAGRFGYRTLKVCKNFRALEEPYWIVSDWVDGLIGPSGLLLLVSHLFISSPSSFSFRDGVGKELVTQIWMWEICLEGSHTEPWVSIELVGARDLWPLWSPPVSLNLIRVLVFFRNF